MARFGMPTKNSLAKRPSYKALLGLAVVAFVLLQVLFVHHFLKDSEPPAMVCADVVVEYGDVVPVEMVCTATDNRAMGDVRFLNDSTVEGCTVEQGGHQAVFSLPGTYLMIVRATDAAGNSTTQDVSITVTDSVPPVIAEAVVMQVPCGCDLPVAADTASVGAKGEGCIAVQVSDVSGIAWVRVDDARFAMVPSARKQTQPVEPWFSDASVRFNQPGAYEVDVTVSDVYGNESSATLSVRAVDETPPVISGTRTNLYLGKHDNPAELDLLAGVTAYDEVDGDVTDSLRVDDSAVVYGQEGTYEVVYTARDSAGNTTEVRVPFEVVYQLSDDELMLMGGLFTLLFMLE